MTAGMRAHPPVLGRDLCRALAVAVAVFGSLAPVPASALRCDRTDNDRAEASRAIRAINGRIDVMESRIVKALRLQTGQLSGYQAQSAKAVIEALDAQTQLQAQIAREVEETRILRDRRIESRTCTAVTGLTGLGAARIAARRAQVQAQTVESGRIAGDRAVTAGAGADSAARFRTVTGKYCNRERGGSETCSGSERLHGADLKAGNLFDRRTLADEEARDIARELSRNLAAPVIHDPPPLGAAGTEQERRLVLLDRSADARTAMAADYFARAQALRAPGTGLGAWAATVLQEEGRERSGNISRYELLEILASRRFDDPDWFVRLQGMGEAGLLRELVMLQAMSLMLDWERYRLDERRGGMEAAGLALDTERTRRLPGLDNPGSGTN